MLQLPRTDRRRSGRAAALAAVAAVASACAGASSAGASPATPPGGTMRYDEAASGSEARVQVAQELEIVLSETRTTGYRWDVVSDGAPVCRLERDAFEPPGPTPGAPGRHAWVFRASQAGDAVIELVYRRPFGSGEPARRFTLRVVAR